MLSPAWWHASRLSGTGGIRVGAADISEVAVRACQDCNVPRTFAVCLSLQCLLWGLKHLCGNPCCLLMAAASRCVQWQAGLLPSRRRKESIGVLCCSW